MSSATCSSASMRLFSAVERRIYLVLAREVLVGIARLFREKQSRIQGATAAAPCPFTLVLCFITGMELACPRSSARIFPSVYTILVHIALSHRLKNWIAWLVRRLDSSRSYSQRLRFSPVPH
jgi:hypothetical protein